MAKYKLLDIPLKQSFANSGITERVPYQLNPQEDNLNWLEGFTDSFQRPVVADDTQQGNGRYIKMGQLNQVLQNLSQAILNIKQSLDNVSETIDKGIKVEIDKVVADAEHALANPVMTWLQTKNNQNCAGLKNFTGVNINNFKNSPTAVANLEWCNGLPIWNVFTPKVPIPIGSNITITNKNVQMLFNDNTSHGIVCSSLTLNNFFYYMHNNYDDRSSYGNSGMGNLILNKGSVVRIAGTRAGACSRIADVYSLIGV